MYSSRRLGRTLNSTRASSSKAWPDTMRCGCLCCIIRFAVPSAMVFTATSSNSQLALAGAQHPSASLRTGAAPLQYKSSTLRLLLSAPLARSGIAMRRAAVSRNCQRERCTHTGSGNQHPKEMLFARGNKTVQRQRIFTHMGVDQERHFGVELAERGVRRKRHLHEVADAAHVHEHLIRSFFAEPSAKLANHRTPVLPLSLRPSTSGLIASVCAIPRDQLGGPGHFALDQAGQEVYMTGCLYNWGAGWMPRRSTVTALFLFTIRSSSDCSSKFARER